MSKKKLAEIIVACIIVIAVVILVATLTPSPSETMFPVSPMVAAGGSRTVGLKSDGSVVAVGNNDYEWCKMGDWTLLAWSQ
jgi:signal peptidase I